MNEINLRMTDAGEPPIPSRVATWIGRDASRFWKRITQSIERNYPGVFNPEWLFGGKKHGWTLRYKKGKSFCTLIPEKNRFAIQIVFGAEERAKVETIRTTLSARTREQYDRAATYHDGKWLFLAVEDENTATDVEKLLGIKRRPKNIKRRNPDRPGPSVIMG